MKLASESINVAENLIVHIVDSDGVEGWGEAASAPTMTGETLPGMVAAVERFISPALLGQPVNDLEALGRILRRSIRANSGAKAAVDIALHDLIAKRKGVPVHMLFGKPLHQHVPAIRMISPAGPSTLAERIGEAAEAGYSHFKLKVGTGVRDDAANVAVMRDVAGAAGHLSADANMGWTVEEARDFLERIADFNLAYLEQPVLDDDVAGMAEIAATSQVPLCIDEALHSPADIIAHAHANAAAGVGVKLIKLGGYAATFEVERLAREAGWNTTYASKIAETSIGAAAILHAAALATTVDWGVSITTQYLDGDIAIEPITDGNGTAAVPAGPGLGVTVDRELLDRYRLN
jgi:muconate cycloisomerase